VRSRRVPTAIGALVCVGLGACSSISGDAIDATHRAIDPTTTSTTTPATTTTVPPGCTNERDALESLRPDARLPTPGEMPEGSYMRTIQNHRRLVAGVDENTLRFSARDPLTGGIDGLEVDIVREIARAITGRDDAFQLKTLVTAQKVPFVEDGTVDLTVSAVSMTCARLGHAYFSTEYYRAEHKLLVRSDSRINDIGDLAGRKVCVTAGSSSVKDRKSVV
jgi:polar amino acid transport system substrate-binding protein